MDVRNIFKRIYRFLYWPKGVLLRRSNSSGLFPFHFHLLPAMPMALLADGGWRALPLARATAVGQRWVIPQQLFREVI